MKTKMNKHVLYTLNRIFNWKNYMNVQCVFYSDVFVISGIPTSASRCDATFTISIIGSQLVCACLQGFVRTSGGVNACALSGNTGFLHFVDGSTTVERSMDMTVAFFKVTIRM